MSSSILWEVRADHEVGGSSSSSYVLGSLHGWNEELSHRSEEILPYISRCSHFLAEINIDQQDPTVLIPYLELPQGISLASVYGEKKYTFLADNMKRFLDLELSYLVRYRPLFVLLRVQQAMIGVESLGMDHFLWNHAKGKGLICDGAEDFFEHFGVFVDIPIDEQARMLYSFVKNFSMQRRKLTGLSAAYSREDIRHLYRAASKGLGKSKSIMLYKRNAKMTSRWMEMMVSKREVFLTVGAAHLWGQYGILALLKRNGYKVKPIYRNERIRNKSLGWS